MIKTQIVEISANFGILISYYSMMSMFLFLVQLISYVIIIGSSQIILNQYSGSIFYGNHSNKYLNSILNCDNDNDCNIIG